MIPLRMPSLPRPFVAVAKPPEQVRFVLVLATGLAATALAAVEADPAGAAETRYLALLASGALAGTATLAPSASRTTPPAWELGWTAILAVLGLWVIGHGPQRGALVTALLTAGLAVATARAAGSAGGVLGVPGRAIGLALAFQVLARCDLLLPPLFDLRTLISLFALPCLAGLALHILARRFGEAPAWLTGVAVAVLAPGFNVTVTLALVALAGGALLGETDLPRLLRAGAGVAIGVPIVWDPALGALFALGGLTFLVRGRLAVLVALSSVTVLTYGTWQRFGRDITELWALGLLLLPALVAARRGSGRALVLRGALLALLAAVVGHGADALAGGIALAALGVPREGPIAELQRFWSNVLALAVLLLATYPWVRREPLETFFGLLGFGRLDADGLRPALLAALALVVGLGGLCGLLRRGRRRLALWPQAGLALVLFVAVARAVPATAEVPIPFRAILLTHDRGTYFHRLEAGEVRGGVIDSHLIHGTGLAPGTPVALVRLRDPEDRLLGSWDLLAGIHTAEWAASRPDVAGRPGFRAPRPWLSHVAPDGSFLAQRFRARFRLPEPAPAGKVVIRLHPGLPEDVEIVIYRLELRR